MKYSLRGVFRHALQSFPVLRLALASRLHTAADLATPPPIAVQLASMPAKRSIAHFEPVNSSPSRPHTTPGCTFFTKLKYGAKFQHNNSVDEGEICRESQLILRSAIEHLRATDATYDSREDRNNGHIWQRGIMSSNPPSENQKAASLIRLAAALIVVHRPQYYKPSSISSLALVDNIYQRPSASNDATWMDGSGHFVASYLRDHVLYDFVRLPEQDQIAVKSFAHNAMMQAQERVGRFQEATDLER